MSHDNLRAFIFEHLKHPMGMDRFVTMNALADLMTMHVETEFDEQPVDVNTRLGENNVNEDTFEDTHSV